MRLLLDHGMPRRSAKLLRDAGFDVTHTGEIGLGTAGNVDILQFAYESGWIIAPLDSDFHTLLALSGAARPSVIRVRIEGFKAREMSDLLMAVLFEWSEELAVGYALSVQQWRVRARRLPFGS